jgi:hypothetical protein
MQLSLSVANLDPQLKGFSGPGICNPEENLGVRIEDDVLVMKDGYQLLTTRLPRTPGRRRESDGRGSHPTLPRGRILFF